MSPHILVRLAFDGTAAGLLLLGLSYWWLGNTVHEIAGTAFFLLIISHNIFNRFWYKRGRKTGDTRSTVNLIVIVLLALTMTALLATSILISEALSGIVPGLSSFTACQLHGLAGYWAVVVVSLHLGLRWPFIMGVSRSLLGLATHSSVRTAALRIAAIAIALYGAYSFFVLGFDNRLTLTTTLDWWNFEESATGFFLHALAVAGLHIVVVYYAMRMFGGRQKGRSVDGGRRQDAAMKSAQALSTTRS